MVAQAELPGGLAESPLRSERVEEPAAVEDRDRLIAIRAHDGERVRGWSLGDGERCPDAVAVKLTRERGDGTGRRVDDDAHLGPRGRYLLCRRDAERPRE